MSEEQAGQAVSHPGAREPRWRVIACFLLMLAAIQLVTGPKIRLSQWQADARSNAGIAEGIAWLHGRLDLPCDGDPDDPENRMHDTASYNGKSYNVFPPFMAIWTVILSPYHDLLLVPEGMWMPGPLALLVFWPLPIVGFIVFRRRVGDSAWAGLLTVAWMAGTAVLPNLHEAQTGLLGQIHHVVSQVGLLVLAADVLGRQRIWPGLIGLAISTYTRQITFLYGLVLLWPAFRHGGYKRLALCGVGLAVIAGPLLTLNTLKFGNPLDFGYRHIYVGREDGYMGARCLAYGTFHPHFIPENLYYMYVAPPRVSEVSLTNVQISDSNQNGTSLWITTPLACWVFIAATRWWRDRKGRILMLGTLPVMIGLLCYHSPGYMEHGYSRFALDFLPIWLVVVAPHTRGGWRTWLTLGCTAWSLLYFQAIVPDSRPGPKAERQMVLMVNHGEV
ncbi:MAG: hypothetical protein JXQ75_02945 [Phycisphaerae bacterium]|nr:hypothetical protein [Phycisphaerae bacterium]